MYKINNRRKPRKNDGYHIMQCIVRAVDERFHISQEFFGLTKNQYKNYFQQCIDNGFIVKVESSEFLAENYNVTPKGHSFQKRHVIVSFEQSFNYGFGTTKIKVESETK